MTQADKNEDLFTATERLTQLGRGPRSTLFEELELARAPRTPFVRIIAESRPTVVPLIRQTPAAERTEAALEQAGQLAASNLSTFAETLADSLRRIWNERLNVVYPAALISRFTIEGVRLEPVITADVFKGTELILGPENREIGAAERSMDPTAMFGGRCLDLYTLATDGLKDPGRGLSSPRKRGDDWAIAWRLAPPGSIVGIPRSEQVVEVALHFVMRDHILTGRGRYLLGGRHSAPGYRKAPDVNSFVVEVASQLEAEHTDVRAAFWLVGDSLDASIQAIHRQVAFAAIGAQGSGYIER